MKYRVGFVSNSSSSSFILLKSKMTEQQIEAITNHWEYWKGMPEPLKTEAWSPFGDAIEIPEFDRWNVIDKGETLLVATFMTNFEMEPVFKALDLSMGAIQAGGGWWGLEY